MQVVWNAYLALSYGHPFVLKQVFYWLLHAAKLITLNSAMSGTWEMFDQMNLRKPKLETWLWVGAGIKVFFTFLQIKKLLQNDVGTFVVDLYPTNYFFTGH